MGPEKTDPALMMFPEEFEKLEPGINAFMRGAFQENPYQETPILSGDLFFQRATGRDAIFAFSQCHGIDR
jgi:type VI secretion system protein ImpL